MFTKLTAYELACRWSNFHLKAHLLEMASKSQDIKTVSKLMAQLNEKVAQLQSHYAAVNQEASDEKAERT